MKQITVITIDGLLAIQADGPDEWVFIGDHSPEDGTDCDSAVGTVYEHEAEGTIAHCARCGTRTMAEYYVDYRDARERRMRDLGEFLFHVPPPPPKTREELEDEHACALEHEEYLNSDR